MLEVKDVDAYTYLRLKTKDGEIWAAVNKAPVAKGAAVTIENANVMTNFESKTLKKTFDRIVFGSLAGPDAAAASPAARVDMAQMHAGVSKPADPGNVATSFRRRRVRMRGPSPRSSRSGRRSRQPVLVARQGREVHGGRDGKELGPPARRTGSPTEYTDDVLVTTLDETKVGDVVVARSAVAPTVDLGRAISTPCWSARRSCGSRRRGFPPGRRRSRTPSGAVAAVGRLAREFAARRAPRRIRCRC